MMPVKSGPNDRTKMDVTDSHLRPARKELVMDAQRPHPSPRTTITAANDAMQRPRRRMRTAKSRVADTAVA